MLYAHGGVYADADAECLKPIASWWEPSKCDAVIGSENDVAVCQWTFASAPRHPLFARAISMIVDRVQAYHVQWGRDVPLMRHSDEHFVHRFTGPGVFTDAVKEEFDLKGLPNPGVCPSFSCKRLNCCKFQKVSNDVSAPKCAVHNCTHTHTHTHTHTRARTHTHMISYYRQIVDICLCHHMFRCGTSYSYAVCHW